MVFKKPKPISKKETPKRGESLGENAGRGRSVHVALKQAFTLNGNRITDAIIEIDHINYGINKKTFTLNEARRSDFTVSDIEKFLAMLDGEYLGYKKVRGKKLRFEIRIDSPIPGKTFDETYLMVFETDFGAPNLIHTITLFRVGN